MFILQYLLLNILNVSIYLLYQYLLNILFLDILIFKFLVSSVKLRSWLVHPDVVSLLFYPSSLLLTGSRRGWRSASAPSTGKTCSSRPRLSSTRWPAPGPCSRSSTRTRSAPASAPRSSSTRSSPASSSVSTSTSGAGRRALLRCVKARPNHSACLSFLVFDQWNHHMERCYSQLELSFGLVTSTHIVTSKWSIGWVGSTVDWHLYNYWHFLEDRGKVDQLTH